MGLNSNETWLLTFRSVIQVITNPVNRLLQIRLSMLLQIWLKISYKSGWLFYYKLGWFYFKSCCHYISGRYIVKIMRWGWKRTLLSRSRRQKWKIKNYNKTDGVKTAYFWGSQGRKYTKIYQQQNMIFNIIFCLKRSILTLRKINLSYLKMS